MTDASRQHRLRKRIRNTATLIQNRWKAILLTLLLVLAVVAVGIVLYLENPYRGDSGRLAAIEDRDDVVLEVEDGTYVLHGGEITDETVGLVVYPGARVHPDSYIWTLAPVVANEDVVVLIPEMPLNLAILDSSAADDVMDRHDEIDQWYVGGHSLGGAMACRYAARNDERVDGVVHLASYCDDSDDLRETDLAVLSVQGTADGVIDRDTERANRDLLGDAATVVEIDGMNHAQFGAYGDQRGDDAPAISDEYAREQLVEALLGWLRDEADSLEATNSNADFGLDSKTVVTVP
ncbi:alpha/beta hydrolase [Halobacteria archaeon AArc-curdl1]|uniref:Alpha/beta hydrolase n=1 Tax=Natronosalvus hydrolyticus TaxID=2979988 RepID=A0AAP2Z835_9EURY|nr:alpha/beta hydrolase [Halobacteria archaeon AArc-curdl1]